MATVIREDNEYLCEIVPAAQYKIGQEFIWVPRLMRVTRKIEVYNPRTGKVFPAGSQFYIDMDVTQKFTIAQVTQVAEGVDTCYPAFIRSSEKSVGFGLNLEYNIGSIIVGKCPPGFRAAKSDSNPYGGYQKQAFAFMGQHSYWNNPGFAKRGYNKKTIILAGYATASNERNYETRWAKYHYSMLNKSGSSTTTEKTVLNSNGSYTMSFANGNLPLFAIDWQRLEYFSWHWRIHQSKDWNIAGGIAVWYGTYYEPEDFLSLGVRIR